MSRLSNTTLAQTTRSGELPSGSIFRWAGSKRKSLGKLVSFWRTNFATYIEPFAGSASLFFRLAPQRAILGDLNEELMFAYAAIRDTPQAVFEALSPLTVSPDTYYNLRELNPSILAPAERAARFIFLNRYCFNGLYRTNRAGLFNVPFGGLRSGSLPTQQALNAYAQLLSRATLVHGDFETTISRATPSDFVYLDPPYALTETRTFREYAKDEFDFGAVWRLRECLLYLNSRKISFVLSYADSDEGRFLAQGFATDTLQVQRHIAGFVSKRRSYGELLVYPKYLRPNFS